MSMASFRNKYTFREEATMWNFLYRELKAGNPAAFVPKGVALWKLYKEHVETDKTESSLTSQCYRFNLFSFRRQMFNHVEDANVSVERIMFIAYALQIFLSGRIRRILEHRHKISIKLSVHHTVESYVLNDDEYTFFGEKEDISVCKNGSYYEEEDEEPTTSEGDMKYEPSCLTATDGTQRFEEEVVSNRKNLSSCDATTDRVALSPQHGGSPPKVDFGPSGAKRKRLYLADCYREEREKFAIALSKQSGYTGINMLRANAELDYAVRKAQELGISLMEYVEKFVRVDTDSHIFDLR